MPEQAGTPSFQIVLPDRRGGQRLTPVKVDSNRDIDPTKERKQAQRQALAIPARFEDIAFQAATYLLVGCFVASFFRTFTLLYPWDVVVFMVCLSSVLGFIAVWRLQAGLRAHLAYMVFLAGLGAVVAYI